jgi:multisite-specific tRNA:(cytosine-C5)-methyltransferase
MDPAFDATNLMVRSVSGLPLRSMYATSASVRAIVSANNYKKIRLISCGTKVLAKQDSGKNETYPCKWRALNDGLTLLHPFISRDKFVTGDMAAVKILLDEAYPALTKFSENLREQLERQELGSCLFEVIPEGTVEDR